MKEKIKLLGAVLLLVVLVPYMVTLFFHGDNAGFFKQHDSIKKMEEKVVLLASEEISGQAQVEAIKAQAVIARTRLYLQPDLEVTGNQENLAENGEQIRFCVEETKGEILTCKGVPIDAAFHKVSAKLTRNAAEVAGQEDKSYLKSVDSSMDIASEEYLTIFFIDNYQLAQAIKSIVGEETVREETVLTDLVIQERDSANYVTKVKYGNHVINGEALRQQLGLSSSAFYLSEVGGKVRIMTKGHGHGLGLSQYGAEALAKEGKKYEEILKYYYTGVEIVAANYE